MTDFRLSYGAGDFSFKQLAPMSCNGGLHHNLLKILLLGYFFFSCRFSHIFFPEAFDCDFLFSPLGKSRDIGPPPPHWRFFFRNLHSRFSYPRWTFSLFQLESNFSGASSMEESLFSFDVTFSKPSSVFDGMNIWMASSPQSRSGLSYFSAVFFSRSLPLFLKHGLFPDDKAY